ncbi:MAG TPA: hypothetical protein VF701_04060 [Thermoanaerobaculia bacterium]
MRVPLGIAGSVLVLVTLWQTVLRPLHWPPLAMVGRYFVESVGSSDTYRAVLMTGIRALIAVAIGYTLAMVLAIATGRSFIGWCAFFFLLLTLQKIPAIAMIDVLVKSRLGIGLAMTTTLASTVVLTFTWLVLHHRAATLDMREVFALRVAGFRRWQVPLYGLLPHLGAAIGGAARLAMSIALVMVILGEWRGVWADNSLWQYGIGVEISRSIDSYDAQARILASCLWLGALGIVLDLLVQGVFNSISRFVGVRFDR